MGANSRQKGAAFERDLARKLYNELGIEFRRDLRQYQESEHGDLIASDDAFPFLIEAKAYAKGTDCKPAWWKQACTAAEKSMLLPAVVWKFNNFPVRVRVGLSALAEVYGCTINSHRTVDLDIPTFCYFAREIMSRRAAV